VPLVGIEPTREMNPNGF